MRRKRRSGNGFGMAIGILFVAVLLLAGFVTSQAVSHNAQAAPEQAYVRKGGCSLTGETAFSPFFGNLMAETVANGRKPEKIRR